MSEFKCPHSVDCANYEPKEKPLFADLKVGDCVYSECFRVGEVVDIGNTIYPICIDFGFGEMWYSANGIICYNRTPSDKDIIRKVDKPKPSNLTMNEAFDLLDNKKASIISRLDWAVYWTVRMNSANEYIIYGGQSKADERWINRKDRLATDWYVVEWV